jgi:hypothetical protein
MKLSDLWTPPRPMAPAMMREQLARLDDGQTFDPDAYNRQLREDRGAVALWVFERVMFVVMVLVWGLMLALIVGKPSPGRAAAPGSCERHASATQRVDPMPSDVSARLEPVPAYRFGGAVLQLYTVSDRRSALIEASDLRTTLAQHEGQAWAVRVTVVPWWSNQWTVVVPDVLPYAADEVCDWLAAFGRPLTPPPAPGRASGRKTCRWFGGPWPMQKPPVEEDR